MDVLSSLNGDHRWLWLMLFVISVLACLKLVKQTTIADQENDQEEDRPEEDDANSKVSGS